jgi:PAS domain S-box-containing protein
VADNGVSGPADDDDLRLLREAMPDAMVIADGAGRIVDVNALAEKLFGADRKTLIGKPVESLMPERFRSQHAGYRQRYAAAPCARPMGQNLDLHCLADAGREIPVEISLNAIDRAAGPLVVATIRETGQRPQVEQGVELAEKASQLQATLDSITEGFALFDSNDKLLLCNDAYRNIVALASDKIHPGTTFEAVVRAMIESQAALFPGETVDEKVAERMSRHRERPNTLEVELADGRWLLVADRMTSDGGTALVQTDITQLKRAEQEARSILDASPLAVGITRASDGEILYVNARHAPLFGVAAADAVGRKAMEFWADPADRQGFIEIFQRDNRVPATEVRAKRLDGSLFWAMLSWERLPLFGADAVLFWIDDISDVVAAREERRAKIEAEAANRAKSEFLSQMSHELRTPLNAILGFAQLLRDYPDQALTAEQEDHVGHILRGGAYLLSLIDEILDLSRIEAGRLPLSLEPMDLAGAVRQSLALTQRLADQNEVSVVVGAEVAAAPQVIADPRRLSQIIVNLLTNAIKFNRSKGTVTVTAAATDTGMVRTSIRDSGMGIPAEKHDEVFRPFSRLSADASGIQGTGIGLAISRQLIESMGGSLDFESTLGEGSTFWFELPIA